MGRSSILWEDEAHISVLIPTKTSTDLLYDDLINYIARDLSERSRSWFYCLCCSISEAKFRQEVYKDLADPYVNKIIHKFVGKFDTVKRLVNLYEKSFYVHEKVRIKVDAALSYCKALIELCHDLTSSKIASRGFRRFYGYLSDYTNSSAFTDMHSEAAAIVNKLTDIEYSLAINGNKIRVDTKPHGQDLSQALAIQFKPLADIEVDLPMATEIRTKGYFDHIQAQVIHNLAKLYPDTFGPLAQFHKKYAEFIDPVIESFVQEVHFYLAFMRFADELKNKGAYFCFPKFCQQWSEENVQDAYDLILASKMCENFEELVANSWDLSAQCKAIVITGANQGGKTTFARSFALTHLLACLGLPVPCKKATIAFVDNIYTHFRGEEHLEADMGMLEAELVALKETLQSVSAKSLVVLNEPFSNTQSYNAVWLSEKVMDKLMATGCLSIWVTFIDELARLPYVLSMITEISNNDIGTPTFRIIYGQPSIISNAIAIAQQHRISYKDIVDLLAK